MSREVVKTSFLRTLFPRVPSKKEVAARKSANYKMVVSRISTGSYLLQSGRYMTEADMETKRQQLRRRK